MRRWGPYLLIVVVWLAAIILINPMGDFPLMDDWSYAGSVRTLLLNGRFQLSDWTSPNQISLIFWGLPYAAFFGTSYTVLRISTLVAALLWALAFYEILRRQIPSAYIAVVATLCVLMAPISLQYSFTFMTDIPYTAAQTGAMLFLVGIANPSRLALGTGWLLGVAALLCRQIGMAIPLARAVAKIATERFSAVGLVKAIIPVAVFGGIQMGYQQWLINSGHKPAAFGNPIGSDATRSIPAMLGHMLTALPMIWTDVAIGIAPLLLLALLQGIRPRFSQLTIFSGVLFLGHSAAFALSGVNFERYAIPLLPCAAIIVASWINPEKRTTFRAGIAGVAALSLLIFAGTVRIHGWLSESRVRMAALKELLHQGVPRENIDAGWDLNGADNFGRYGDPKNLFSWFKYREYVVGMVPVPGYAETARYHIPKLNPLGASVELVQKIRRDR